MRRRGADDQNGRSSKTTSQAVAGGGSRRPKLSPSTLNSRLLVPVVSSQTPSAAPWRPPTHAGVSSSPQCSRWGGGGGAGVLVVIMLTPPQSAPPSRRCCCSCRRPRLPRSPRRRQPHCLLQPRPRRPRCPPLLLRPRASRLPSASSPSAPANPTRARRPLSGGACAAGAGTPSAASAPGS